MGYNRFFLYVVLLSILIAGAAFAFVWSIFQPHIAFGRYTFGAIFIVTIVALVNYVNSYNKNIAKLLSTFQQTDTISNSTSSKSLAEIKTNIDRIATEVKEANIEKEIEHKHFAYTLDKISTAVITYNQSGIVKIFNKKAETILGIKKPINITVIANTHKDLIKLFSNRNQPDLYKIDIEINGKVYKILGETSIIVLDGETNFFITLTDITNQLNDEEISSYYKLIRVMAHEIMNSVSPIKSLLNTLIGQFQTNSIAKDTSELTNKDIENTIIALNAMHKRAQGLMQFVESYRKLTKIPQPILKRHKVSELVDNVISLKKSDLNIKGIEITTQILPENLTIIVDESLINQVLINLILNSIESIESKGFIKVISEIVTSGMVEIRVIDNGKGIDKELIDKVFIPFFTTKKEGSGIGLSLARDIIKLHGGYLSLTSIPNYETIVTIQLPPVLENNS